MLLGTLLTGEIAKSALVAYVHYLGIILCFGSLLFERLTLKVGLNSCLLYTSPSPRDGLLSRMPSSA